MKVPLTRPYLDEQEVEAVREVLESGWLIQGSKTLALEEGIAKYTGAKYAKATSSCTTALHTALLALGVTRDDVVVVPAFTFVATANVAEYIGAQVVFTDIDLNTFNMDTVNLDRVLHIQRKSRKKRDRKIVIVPVHLFGLCADMANIKKLADYYTTYILEDAACALGSVSPEGKAGVLGDIACFSFHPRKSLTTGEGGMLVTDDEILAELAHSYRDFGFTGTNLERHKKGATFMSQVQVLGYNYRITDIQSAIGLVQLSKFDWIINERIRRAEIYNKELHGISWMQLPYTPEGYKHTYQSYIMMVMPDKWCGGRFVLEDIAEMYDVRQRFTQYLAEKEIATRQGTHAVHTLGYYKNTYGYEAGEFINAYCAERLGVTIPLYPQMSDDEQQYVIDAIKGFMP